MHPQTRFSLALLASLALWWPTLQGALAGSVDPIAASLRWVAAFVVASLALRLLSGLVDAYSGDAVAPATTSAAAPVPVEDPEDTNVG